MAEITRTIPITKQSSILLDGSTGKGNSRHNVGIIGKVGSDQKYRELIQAAFEWLPTDYQIKAAWLDFSMGAALGEDDTNGDPGANPNITIRALGVGFEGTGGGGPNDWGPSAKPVWPGPSFGLGTTAAKALAAGFGARRINVVALVEDIMPATIKRRNGSAGGGGTHFGWSIYSTDETSTGARATIRTIRHPEAQYRPVLTVVLDDNLPPPVPTIRTPEPASDDPTIVASANGSTITVDFLATARTGDTITLAELQVYGPAATADETDPGAQTVTGALLQTSGAVTPRPTGETNRYTVTITGVPTRSERLIRLRVRNQKGAWSRWTALEDGRIQTAYVPGVPIDPRLTTDPLGPVLSATLNTQDPGDFVTAITGTFVRHNTDGTTTNLWPNLGVVSIGGSTTRPELPWAGVGLADGDAVSWTVSLANRDGVWSPPTSERTTIMRTALGPVFDPTDATEALQSRTGPIDIHDDVAFDAYRYRLYRNDVLIYTSLITPSGPGTDDTITLPAGYLTWGDTFGIEAETRPTDTNVFGPTSPRAYLYIDTLPSVGVWYASDGEGFVGTTLPTVNPVWHAEYDDPDAARFGEAPTRKELEIREYAAVPSAGSLFDRRIGVASIKAIPIDEETGRRLLLMDTATGWVGDTNVSVGVVASRPAGYDAGDAVRLTFASSSTDRGARHTFAEPLDLTGFSSHTFFSLYVRESSVTNLTNLRMRLESSLTDWMEWIIDPDAGLNTWDPESPNPAAPSATLGDIDWSAIESLYVWADVTGAFAGTVDLFDLGIGDELVAEERYNARVRYGDGADPLVVTTLAASASAGATTVKVTSVDGMAIGQDLTLEADSSRLLETRTITAVGTAGSGGTGVTVSEAYTFAHDNLVAARVLPWGPWSSWLTVKVSEPPSVVALSPDDAATITDPTQVFTWSFTSPSSKAQSYFVFRLFRREDDVDRLVYERDGLGTDAAFTAPYFLLEDDTDYAWEIAAYDTDGLYGTTERRTLTTDFTALAAVTDLAAVADPVTSTVTVSWTYVAGAAFYIVRWRDPDGRFLRVDLGPRELDDGRTPLVESALDVMAGDTTVSLAVRIPRLGLNTFQVSVHDGALESEIETVEVTLTPARTGAWMIAVDDERGIAWAVDATEAPRTPTAVVETFRPPGRPFPVHHHWGTGGRSTSLRFNYLPSADGPLARQMTALLAAGTPVYVKAPTPYDWDVMRARIVGVGPEAPQPHGWVSLSLDLEEIAPEAPE